MNRIAVLLTCYNRKQKTLSALELLFAQEGLGKEYSIDVYLVDDASTDGTSEAVQSQFPAVRVVKGTGSLYWNRGMHLAWKTAAETDTYDFYLWLNDDTKLLPSAIKEVLEDYRMAGSESVIVGSTCSELSHVHTYGARTLKGEAIIPNGTLQECRMMNGNFVLVSNIIFQSVGIIDPVYPHAIGDHDYGWRVVKKGYKIFVARNYIGFCEEHDSLPTWCLPEAPFKKRIKALYSPLGNSHPYYYFIYEKRHYGLFTAVKHYFTIHLRVLIPRLWK